MPQATLSDDLTTLAGMASAVASHARSYGIDIDPICKTLEIDPAHFQDLTARVSIDRLCRLLETCALLANDEAFGIKSAAVYEYGSMGPFSYGLLAAPTIRHFVLFHSNHMRYLTATSSCDLQEDERGIALCWTLSPLIVKRDQYVDLLMAVLMKRLRHMLGTHADLIELELERPRPRNHLAFREYLTKRLTFSCPMNRIRVPVELLDFANPEGDERLYKLMDLQCRMLCPDQPRGGDFVEQVRRYLRLRMTGSVLSLADVAKYFGVSERTFQRRLAEQRTTLQDLRDDERRELSRRLLLETQLSISAICHNLGYSAPSAFTRSVVRWFGVSPRSLRENGEG